jgi:chemotaxis protein MotB
MALSAALVNGCVEELPTIPQETGTPIPVEPARKSVVTSSAKEFVPGPNPLARELEACTTALADAQARLAALERENTTLSGALADESQTRQRLEQRVAEETQSAQRLQQRFGELQNEAARSRDAERRLTLELEAAQKKAAESQTASQQQIDLAEQEISRRKAALAETTRHLATLDQEKQKIAAALAEHQQRLQELTTALSVEQARAASLTQENQRLGREYDALKKSLESEIADRDLKLRHAQSRLVLSILDHVLFDSGETTLKPSGMKVLDHVSAALKKISDREIHVEGHTDNRPTRGPLAKRYPTNWELSTSRATTVVRYLIEQAGLPAPNLSAVGYADTRPVAPNDTEASRAENRRIEILLYPKGLPRTPQPVTP